MAKEGAPDWLLLVLSLPTGSATARMRVWRALKGLGCVALRDGAYLRPAGDGGEAALAELGEECIHRGRDPVGRAEKAPLHPRVDDPRRAAWGRRRRK